MCSNILPFGEAWVGFNLPLVIKLPPLGGGLERSGGRIGEVNRYVTLPRKNVAFI